MSITIRMKMQIKRIGDVNAEGGPLIYLDSKVAPHWHGIENGGMDYQRVCDFLEADDSHREGGIISINAHFAILWEMAGGGTAEVFQITKKYYIVVRSWPLDLEDLMINSQLACLKGENPLKLGSINILSSFLIILWAPESGNCIGNPETLNPGRPTGEMAIDSAGLIVRCLPGVYEFTHDTVRSKYGDGRRCHIKRISE